MMRRDVIKDSPLKAQTVYRLVYFFLSSYFKWESNFYRTLPKQHANMVNEESKLKEE